MIEIEYLIDNTGQQKAVVIPIELWRQLLPQGETSIKEMSENIEDYCLNKAMDEALQSPLLNRLEALRYLEDD